MKLEEGRLEPGPPFSRPAREDAMLTRGRCGVFGGLLLTGFLAAGLARAAGDEPKAAPKTASAAESLCANCHDQAKVFAGNAHALVLVRKSGAGPDAACESCHGEGSKHAEEGGDKSLIRGLRGVEGAKFCLTCHNKATDRSSFGAGSTHASSATVNCLSCHSIHASEPQSSKLLAKATGALCQGCHPGQSASIRSKPYAHRLDRGGMTCVDCHNPHGRPGRGSLALTRAGELPCLNCHAEKRGPFVFEHVSGIAGNCLSCHQPHGSSNPKMLQWTRVDQQCLSCHSRIGGVNTIGSQPPAIHDLTLPRYRNCTTCHTAVHGSNLSPRLFK
jgi:DmsE family decaheme c-type cytochrome